MGHNLWNLLSEIRRGRFVDLTHAFEPDIPHAPDMPNEQRIKLFSHEKDGFLAHLYTHAGQWGTHVDPPVHYHADGRFQDEILVDEMILPMIVIDIQDRANQNPDYELVLEDVIQWESRNGIVPPHSFVALRSGWSARWPDPVLMHNADAEGVYHFPGWGMSAMRYLCEERNITACGHETTDTDPGISVSRDQFLVESYLLGTGRYQIEMLASLDSVPEAGAIGVATFPKPKGGSGFPARVFAIVEE